MSAGRYALEYTTAAARQVSKLDTPVRRRVMVAIERLADDPRPAGCRALVGRDGYRVRVGDWRVIYTVEDTVRVVLVEQVGHRSSIYG